MRADDILADRERVRATRSDTLSYNAITTGNAGGRILTESSS